MTYTYLYYKQPTEISGDDLLSSLLFCQLWRELQSVTNEKLRMSYTHPMDDGQSRTFKVRLGIGSCVGNGDGERWGGVGWYYGGRIKLRVLGNQLHFEIVQGSTQFLSLRSTHCISSVLRLLFENEFYVATLFCSCNILPVGVSRKYHVEVNTLNRTKVIKTSLFFK